MRRKEVIEFLNQLEANFPVNDWVIRDVHIWPMIKRELYFQWEKASRGEKGKKKKRKAPLSVRLKYIAGLFGSVLYWFRLILKPKKNIDVFYAGAWTYRVDYEEKYINRYYYPLIKKNSNQSFLQLEYHPKNKRKKYPYGHSMIFLEKLFPVALSWTLLTNVDIKEILPEYSQLMKEVDKILGLRIGKKKMSSAIIKFRAYGLIYQYLFNKYNPKVCYGLCYYNDPMFPYHYIANQRKIENYDVQHGGQGALHPMYYFQNPLKNGYNILPQKFWVWDHASLNNIKTWVKKQDFHQVELKGNPWIQFQLKQYFPWSPTLKKIILYTLQEDYLDEYIIDAVDEGPTEWEWWLRLHPRKKWARERIESQLKERGVLNRVEIDKATDLPLPQILKHASIHISKFSGSIIEAVQVGTNTIIIDEVGKAIFKDYIENQDVSCLIAEQGSTLVKHIQEIISSENIMKR